MGTVADTEVTKQKEAKEAPGDLLGPAGLKDTVTWKGPWESELDEGLGGNGNPLHPSSGVS